MTESLSLSYKLDFWDLLVRYESAFKRTDSWIARVDTKLVRDKISKESEKSLAQVMVEEELLPKSMLDGAHKAEELASEDKISTHAMVLILGGAFENNPVDPWQNIVFRGWESGDDYDPATMEEIISQINKGEELRQQSKTSEQIAKLVEDNGLKPVLDEYVNSVLDPRIFYGSTRSSAIAEFSKGLEKLVSLFGLERIESTIASLESGDKEVKDALIQLKMQVFLNNQPGYLQKHKTK